MTVTEHRKTVAMTFFIIGLLDLVFWVIARGWRLNAWIFLIYSALFIVTGWFLHNERPGAKALLVISSLICLPSFPIGTVIGIYGLWYVFQCQTRESISK